MFLCVLLAHRSTARQHPLVRTAVFRKHESPLELHKFVAVPDRTSELLPH